MECPIEDKNEDSNIKINDISLSEFNDVSQESNLSLLENKNILISLNTLFSSGEKEEDLQSSISPMIPSSLNCPINRFYILSSFTNKTSTEKLIDFLNNTSEEMIENIINELKGIFQTIIKDKNGNYFCSELFKICEQSQRIKILNELADTISQNCCDKYSTYPIQILIELSSCENEYKLLLKSFDDQNKLLFASLDPIGSYVIKKIIEHIPEKFRMKFNMQFIKFITFISMKKFGLINAKKFIAYTKNKENIKQIINLVSNNFISIATNSYGNYLVQYILEKWNNYTEINEMKVEIIDKFIILCQNKFSSYICDLFIKLATIEEKSQLMNIMNLNMEKINNNQNAMKFMFKIKKFFEPNYANIKTKNNIHYINKRK